MKLSIKNLKSIYRHQNIFKMSIKYSSTGKLFVEPLASLVTEPISISGKNFQPNSPITIQASVDCPSEKISFTSLAHYLTNHDGSFNLQETEAYGGSYTETHDMGLFWSMKNRDHSLNRIQTTNASIPLTYTFNVYNGEIIQPEYVTPNDTVAVTRAFLNGNTIRLPVKSGNIRGTIFIPDGDGPFPTIITMYGGNKRKAVVEDAAGILSNNGFVTLALAYFGVDDLPKSYTAKPLRIEYFEEAVEYLCLHDKVKKDSIGVWGLSKGGELGLGMIQHLPQIKAICCINCSIASSGSATTYKGNKIDALTYDLQRAKVHDDNTINIMNVVNDPKDEPNSIIKFETTKADVLWIVGLDDISGHYELFADMGKERMDNIGKTNYEVIKYPGIGHLVDVPYMPPCLMSNHPVDPSLRVLFGGDTLLQSISQDKMWKKIFSFFKKTLKSN